MMPSGWEPVPPLPKLADLPDLPDPADSPAPPVQGPTPPRRSRAGKIWAIVLGVLLILALCAGGVLLYFFLQTSNELDNTNQELDRRNQQIQEQEDLLEEQREQLDEKEVFGQAMQGLMSTVQLFDGLHSGDLISYDRLDYLAQVAWAERHDVATVREATAEAGGLQAEFQGLLDTAAGRAGNTSGTTAESIIDSLGRGFVETVWGDASAMCETEALGCVWGGEPYVIHLDNAGFSEPFRTEWGEQLVAYHEYAHVLQFTNLLATIDAEAAFGGDSEIMADCYALTALDGWTLDERVWSTSNSYWDVRYGYGYVCDESQRQVIRDWMSEVGVKYRAVEQ